MEANLEDKDKFKDLRKPMAVKWKISSLNKKKTWCQVVPYVDSRDVQNRFDSVLGPENWQDNYYTAHDSLYCAISVRVDKGEWISKSDCGDSDSLNEKAKGDASDAFKRAAVKWGVGRFLYNMVTYWYEYNEGSKKPLIDGKEIKNLNLHMEQYYDEEMIQITEQFKKEFGELNKGQITHIGKEVYKRLGIHLYYNPELFKPHANKIYDIAEEALVNYAKINVEKSPKKTKDSPKK